MDGVLYDHKACLVSVALYHTDRDELQGHLVGAPEGRGLHAHNIFFSWVQGAAYYCRGHRTRLHMEGNGNSYFCMPVADAAF